MTAQEGTFASLELSKSFVCVSNVCLFFYYRLPVNTLSSVIFNTLVRLKVCHKPIRTYDVGAPSAFTISLPGMDPVDAERRRYVVHNVKW